MSNSAKTTPGASMWNVPNVVTMARLVLAIVLFVLLPLGWYLASVIVLALAAGTDWLDGYWARRYGQITQLGRVLDPFADKLIICGAFIFLACVAPLADGTRPSGIAGWMVVVVVARELLVTVLRSLVEQSGGDFSAKWIGKWKMVLQCVAAGWSMVHLTYLNPTGTAWQTTPPGWMTTGLTVVVWGAVLLTAYSGYPYVRAAIALLKGKE